MNRRTDEVTLFLIEDDDVDAMSVERGFRKQRLGNPIVRAQDGQMALDMLRGGLVTKPYIALLDLQMPRMNGFEFLDAIRLDPDLNKTVIFVLTTSRDQYDIDRSYQQHIAGYFVKEDAGSEFVSVITMLDSYWRIAHLPSPHHHGPHPVNPCTS